MMITAEIKEKFYKTTNHHASYTYYRCTRKSQTIQCDDLYIREEALDEQLSHLLQTVSLRPDWAKLLLLDAEGEAVEVVQSVTAIVVQKRAQIALLETKLHRLLNTYLDQDIEKSTYRKKKQELVVEKKALEESIFTLQQS